MGLFWFYISFHYFTTSEKPSLYIYMHPHRENKLMKKAAKKANTAACIDPREAPASKISSTRTLPGKITSAQLHYLF